MQAIHQPLSFLYTGRWFYAFLLAHIIAWTLAPVWVRFNLPMDALEGTIWGHQLEWGYDKNPFMNAWLTALAIKFSPQSGWMTYLFSQLSVGVSLWAVWQLGKKMAPPLYALIAVILLETNHFYNFHAIDFNDNTLELSLWALTTLFFYQALCHTQYRDWLLTGLFAGLAMMTKYYSAILLLVMLIFMLLQAETRKQFVKPPLYLGIIIFFIVIAPHTLWLFSHDFITVTYMLVRVDSPPTWLNHLFYPAQFFWQITQVFLPAIVMLLLLLPIQRDNNVIIAKFDLRFLLFIGIGPFLLTLLLSALFGMKLRAGWGQPLMSLWGLLLLVWLKPVITPARFYRFVALLFLLMMTAVSLYCYALIQAKAISSANFPGKNIAYTLEKEWHNRYHTALKYVVGPRWLAGNIAFYSADQPNTYMEANAQRSPWIDEKKLTQEGAIFVWDPTESEIVSFAELKKRFPDLEPLRTLYFPWLRNKKSTPVEINVAFLSPSQSQS